MPCYVGSVIKRALLNGKVFRPILLRAIPNVTL
jgi:hypothetical protein